MGFRAHSQVRIGKFSMVMNGLGFLRMGLAFWDWLDK